MLIEVFEGGPVATNGYLVADHPGEHALIIDAPQGTAVAMVAKAREWNTPVSYLITTHGHWDHILDNARILKLTGAKLAVHRDSAPLLTRKQGFGFAIEPSVPDFFLEEGTPVVIGDLRFEILHCPGHCPGSVVLYERRNGVAFAGDVLFAGSIGRTDLPGGDYEELMRSIREKLLVLPDETRVFPGHGPATTIGEERRTNPFLAG